MPTPTPEQVQAVLDDFHDRIRKVVDAAWAEWLAYPGRAKVVFVARLRAVFVFDAIARLAQAEFDDDKNIHVIIKRQTIQFLFKDQVLIRFKKGNAKGIGSNITTEAVLDFVDPQRVIPGLIPDIMKVEVCYSPDALGIALKEVAVVARDEARRLWAYPLARSEPAAEVVTLPPRQPDHTPPVVVPRKPKPEEQTGETE